MRKVIYAINLTLDGFADHTEVIADDELHDFYTNLLGTTDTIIFGRKTYQLMESYWPQAPLDPNATTSTIDFANKINSINKIVYSGTLEKVTWNKTTLIKKNIIDELRRLKELPGKDISISGITTASTVMKHGLIDEYWFLIQPIILGKGRRVFSYGDGFSEEASNRENLELIDTQRLQSGVVVLHYRQRNLK